MNIINHPWSALFFAGYLAFLIIRGRYASATWRQKNVHRQVDRLETILLLLVIPSNLLVPLLYLFTPLLSFADYQLPAMAPWFGAVLMAVAVWLFWRTHADLGRNWSVSLEVREGHTLITHGVYLRVRHPMYTAIFLYCIAQGLLLPNWLAGWSSLVPFIIMYVFRVRREEQMMLHFFGDEYRAYMNRTGRLLPRLQSTA
jgi:protein-S-isoprenylcysteine O-methyltransferase Ste14